MTMRKGKFDKLKTNMMIGAMVIGSVSDAYKGKTPQPEKTAADYQKSQDLERRGRIKESAPEEKQGGSSPPQKEKDAARRRIMDQMRDRQAKEKKLEKQKGKGRGIGE